jgi:DNA-binding protein HU-beta
MKQIIDTIAAEFGTTKKDAKAIIETVITGILAETKEAGKFRIGGFGTFSIKEKKARKGRNPKTGEEIQIEAKTVLAFKPAKDAI